MKKIIFLISLLLLISGISLIPAFAQKNSLKEVLNNPSAFDRKVIEIEGEVIGEPLKAEGGLWINIASGSYNIGVFSSDLEVLNPIEFWGSYKEKGDRVRIKGTFYKNCPWHQISDVHLTTLEVVEKGYKKEILVSPQKVQLSIILFTICLATATLYFIKRKYGRKT